MVQSQDKNNKWYQNSWFILTVSVVMIALLVFSVFLSHQWSTIERTIFGNKAFYYKMEMDNFSSVTGMFLSAVDYSYEAKTQTIGTIETDNLSLNVIYQNDDEEKVSNAELSLYKKSVKEDNGVVSSRVIKSKTPIAQMDLFLNNSGAFVEFPYSGYATELYHVHEKISRRMFTADWMQAINNDEVSWAVYDVLQAVNNVVPDDKVFHYDEVEFDGFLAHKIEFVIDENTQFNIKKAFLECISKKEIKNVLKNVEKSLEEKLYGKDETKSKSGAKHKKTEKKRNTIYKWIKNYIEQFPVDSGDIVYSVIYDNDQNILSREIVLQDNRIQVLSYMESDGFVLGFFNEKAGLNIENKCTFNSGAKGIEGRLIIDSGPDELGVIYQCSEIIGGVIPVGTIEVVSGKTGVAEADAGAVPIWRGNLSVQKEQKKVFANFSFEKNQKRIISATGNFLVNYLDEKVDKIDSARLYNSKPIRGLSGEKMLAEAMWNYTLFR